MKITTFHVILILSQIITYIQQILTYMAFFNCTIALVSILGSL